MRSKYGFLHSYRLYNCLNDMVCLVIPSEDYVRVLGYGPYFKKFDGTYTMKEFDGFKRKHNLSTRDEAIISTFKRLQERL